MFDTSNRLHGEKCAPEMRRTGGTRDKLNVLLLCSLLTVFKVPHPRAFLLVFYRVY